MKISASKFGRNLFLPLILLLTAMSVQAKPPNIIFVLTDDLNEEVFSHASRINTLIGDQGAKFTNNFVTLSLCCPSRTATLRGQFAHNTGVFTNNLPDGGFAKVYSDGLENSTVATWLQAAGYRTALFGKYLNGYPNAASGKTYIPPGWTRWVSPNGGSPYSEYNYSLNQNGTTVSYGSAPSDYLVDVLSDKAATFINNTLTNYPNKPFFLYVAPYVPHGPATPPPRYANDFPGIQAPRTASFNEADVSDKPAWIRNNGLLTSAQIGNIDDLYRKRRQTIKAVGDLVENLINTLQAKGELNNTYIFFASDNGFHQGQHRLNSGKNSPYEEDLKVPLLVRGPGITPGTVIDHITANVDFAPTWAAIAGVTPPNFVDGRSLLPLLNGATPPVWRQALLLEHGGPSITPATTDGLLEPQDPFDVQAASTGGAPIFAGLRTKSQAIGANGPLTYVEYDTGEGEFYDLTTDPDQLNNIYSSADPALRAKLNTWLGSLRHATGQALRDAEQTPP